MFGYFISLPHLSSLFLSPFPHVHCIAVSDFKVDPGKGGRAGDDAVEEAWGEGLFQEDGERRD